MKLKKLFLLIFLMLVILPQFSFSQDVQVQQQIQQFQQRVIQINNSLKDYKFFSHSTRGLIKSAIILCPETYRDFAIEQFKTILNIKLKERKIKIVSRDMVIEALKEMMPADIFPSAKEALGITRDGRVPFEGNSFHRYSVEKNENPSVQNNQ